MRDVVIVGACRSAIGKFGGSLSATPAVKLGSAVIESAVKRSGLSVEDVDYVIMGNVLQANLGQNPARQASIGAGIGVDVPAFTVNEVCGSGLKAVHLGMQSIMLGENDTVVVGGFENMSMAPQYLENARFGTKLRLLETQDAIFKDGLIDAFSNDLMGITAENIAKKYNVSRERQDAFALDSQLKASRAIKEGKFKEEIVPIPVKDGLFEEDEFVRHNSTIEGLERLKPSFIKEGTVTAGNASGINDGSAALVLMSREKAEAMNLPILATIEGYTEIGMDPSLMGYSPYYAIKKLLSKQSITHDSVDRYEINEAFASQSVAVLDDLELDLTKVNVNGGAIALGHPIGSSGARILVSLIHELRREELSTGIASLCIGGGLGMAMLIKTEF
ncbi:acetyl-CoA C-acetyltransferase [Erysipelothrix inopinata]|uniref:acetyl-CoA C-acetyltransferase n=1 Tax=Erysipelothrix inopinata TaxID=225084 RepID=A0A7G9S087_9FIRM|nr:acetyl-CoA C-acetyltransferase [Erysipelothrix inopinata]QNN61262.1 acetyl-CoA C-acetyltransferase [Erysipelothrix inopinata]